jgi:predicted DNA-binding transcriptional regulator AlpA
MPYFTVIETSEKTGLSTGTLRLYLGQGRFPKAGKINKKTWLIPESDIEKFLAAPRDPGRPAQGKAKRGE